MARRRAARVPTHAEIEAAQEERYARLRQEIMDRPEMVGAHYDALSSVLKMYEAILPVGAVQVAIVELRVALETASEDAWPSVADDTSGGIGDPFKDLRRSHLRLVETGPVTQ